MAEHDGVVEGGGVGAATRGALTAPRGELGDGGRGLVGGGRGLLLLDAGGGGALGPPPAPHPGVAGVGLVLGAGALDVLGLQVAAQLSVV